MMDKLYEMKLSFLLITTNGFHIKAQNERVTVPYSCCHQDLKVEIFTSLFGRLCQTLDKRECHTCSTTIFLHSTNHIIDLWWCHCHRLLSCLLSLTTSSSSSVWRLPDFSSMWPGSILHDIANIFVSFRISSVETISYSNQINPQCYELFPFLNQINPQC